MQVGFYVRENIRKCERIPILRADDIRPYTDNRTGMVPTTQYHAELRIGAKITHRRANSGILGETRREVLHERERTSVRDRAGTALTTQYHAELRIGDLREAVV